MCVSEDPAGIFTCQPEKQVLKEVGAIFLTHGVTSLALQP